MNIAELFVSLGIKGSEKTVGALTDTKKGLSGVASASLEAKAALVGAMYALERMFANSGAAGTGLTNFSSLTGLSAKQLQQWQFAARQAGVANEEFSGSLKAVQGAMTNMLLGKGAPEGLAMLANKVGFDAKKARDTFYVMEQLQKFAKSAPADVGNSVLKSFGISEGTIAAMRRNAFTPQQFAKAPTYSDNEIQALDKANIAWSNLGQKIEMAFGRFNAKHGGQLVKDISMITDLVIKLAEALEKVSTKFKLFETVGHGLEGIANTLKLVTEIADKFEGKESKPGDMLYTPPGQEALPGFKDSPVGKFFRDVFGGNSTPPAQPAPLGRLPVPAIPGENGLPRNMPATPAQAPKISIPAIPPTRELAAPRMPVMPSKGPEKPAQNINIKQDLHFQHEGKDHKQTADSVRKANQDAFRQFSQGQVS